MNDKKVWFITGCSTGFGRELSKQLLENGYRVAVTARNVEQVQDLVEINNENAIALELDVTDKKQVTDAIAKAEAHFGRIDVLVNNAGFGYFGAIEESDEREVRAMFEANFWGLSEITRAVLPKMRERKSGTIVNISSIGGFVGFPGVGYYNATKFAVNGFSEALQKELKPLGIDVIIVEPSGFRTDWAGRSANDATKEIDDYAETAGRKQRCDPRIQRKSTGRSGSRGKSDCCRHRSGKSAEESAFRQSGVEKCAFEIGQFEGRVRRLGGNFGRRGFSRKRKPRRHKRLAANRQL